MRRQEFAYELPPELIAQDPLRERSASRMLVLDGDSGAPCDRQVRDLPEYLRAGDLLVLTDTRVVPARLLGTQPSGGRVEVLLERALGDCQALAQISASKTIRDGLQISTAGGVVRVIAREEGMWRIALPQPALQFFQLWGAIPLPPYIHRAAVEPVIGHLKNEHRMDRNYLHHRSGDANNATLAAIGYNFSLLLRWLRLLLRLILAALPEQPAPAAKSAAA